jgi:exopolysaccharide production protein ExoQ
MPPPLAACIFVAFILWALRRYSKEAAPMKPALWVPLIWVIINSSRPLTYWFVSGTEAAEAVDISEGSFLDRNVYLCLMAIGIIILLRRKIDWGSLFSESRWLWILYGYLLVSVLWAPEIFISFKRWFKDTGDLVMILIILTEKDPVEAIRGIFIRCAYVLVPLSVLFIKWYPSIGRYTHRWTYTQGFGGITLSKNELGLLAMLSGLFLLWHIVDVYKIADACKRLGARAGLRPILHDLLVLIMCLWILWVAQSATASSCFMLGAAIFLGTRLRLIEANFRRLGWCLFGVALVLLTITVSANFRELVTGVLGRNATLTERTEIWERALHLETNPLIGSGFSSVWLTPKGAALSWERGGLSHSHNGYLETYLNSGWIGVCLLVAALCVAGRNATRHLAEGTVIGRFFMALFLSGLFYNYSEVTFFFSNTMGFLLWLLALASYRLVAKEEVSYPDEDTSVSFAGDLELSGAESIRRS